jgi:hypothetical protein
MVDFPVTMDDAIAQARSATQAAIAAGYTRLQVELLLPELKPLPIAAPYLTVFEEFGSGLKVFFSDAGAAALARRDWAELPYRVKSLDVAGARQTSTVEELVDPEDQAVVFIAPTAVEVSVVEQVCKAVGEIPVVLFNPRLEDVGTVGIGYTARKMRDRFLTTFEPCYYLRPLAQSALLRCYPAAWQVWLEGEERYTLLAEEPQKPNSERLDQIFAAVNPQAGQPKRGFLSNLQQFLKALSQ